MIFCCTRIHISSSFAETFCAVVIWAVLTCLRPWTSFSKCHRFVSNTQRFKELGRRRIMLKSVFAAEVTEVRKCQCSCDRCLLEAFEILCEEPFWPLCECSRLHMWSQSIAGRPLPTGGPFERGCDDLFVHQYCCPCCAACLLGLCRTKVVTSSVCRFNRVLPFVNRWLKGLMTVKGIACCESASCASYDDCKNLKEFMSPSFTGEKSWKRDQSGKADAPYSMQVYSRLAGQRWLSGCTVTVNKYDANIVQGKVKVRSRWRGGVRLWVCQ